jgi:hypothetical protein
MYSYERLERLPWAWGKVARMIFVFLKWVSTLVAHMITLIVLSTIMLCMDLQHVSSVS